jgi:hypothetical protein
MSDAGEIRRYLVDYGYVPAGASTWDCLEALDAVTGRVVARLEAALAARDAEIARLTEALVGLGVGASQLDLLRLKRSG